MNTTAWDGPKGAWPDDGRACLVVSLLAGSEEPRTAAVELLSREFGLLAALSGLLAFDHTDYYEPEMGAGLTRRLASFQEPLPLWYLPLAKRACLEIESRLAGPEGRRVNLDPGLLSEDSLVLASTKPRAGPGLPGPGAVCPGDAGFSRRRIQAEPLDLSGLCRP